MLALIPLLAMPDLIGADPGLATGTEALATETATAAEPGHDTDHGDDHGDDHGAGRGDDGHGTSLSLVEGLPGWQVGLVTVAAVGLVVLLGTYLTRPMFRFISTANLREIFVAAALLFVIGIALLMTLVGLSRRWGRSWPALCWPTANTGTN